MSQPIEATVWYSQDVGTLYLFPHEHTPTGLVRLCDVQVLPGARLWRYVIDTGLGVYVVKVEDGSLNSTTPTARLVQVDNVVKVVGSVLDQGYYSRGPAVYYTQGNTLRVITNGIDSVANEHDVSRIDEIRDLTDDYVLYTDNTLVVRGITIPDTSCACTCNMLGGHLFTCSTDNMITTRTLDNIPVTTTFPTRLDVEIVCIVTLNSRPLMRPMLMVTETGKLYVSTSRDSTTHLVPIEGRVIEILRMTGNKFSVIALDDHLHYTTTEVTLCPNPLRAWTNKVSGPMSHSNGVKVTYPRANRIKSATS